MSLNIYFEFKIQILKPQESQIEIKIWKAKSKYLNLNKRECQIQKARKIQNSSFLQYSARLLEILEIHEFWGGTNLSEPLFLSGFGAKKSTPEKCIF